MNTPTLVMPERWSQRRLIDNNAARQLLDPQSSAVLEQDGGSWVARTADGATYPVGRRGTTPPGATGLEVADAAWRALPTAAALDQIRWVTSDRTTDPGAVLRDLENRFVLRVADVNVGTSGLRIPQAGALYAALAHWSTGSFEPATVVLPTGTGKTETMLALFAKERLPKLLILVPSDNLRTQIAEVFERYGVLPRAGVLDRPSIGPVVGRIEHHFESAANVRDFVDQCNVIVTTPPALNASQDDVVDALVRRCTHLFVDEAHHVPAKSWTRIRDAFAGKPVLQFTATPYREDGGRLGGRVVYSFPLGRARELGYFQPINYISVVSLSAPDRAVAAAAVERLREDLNRNFDHLIMARVNRITRARDDVLPIYQELAPEFEPQVLHSDLKPRERDAALAAIRERRSRIVVCVDMLGEGFDFPELKIAALHDPHRSLGVALQFIGRFARTRADLGAATAVVSRPEPGYDARLRALYAERIEWDAVIENLSAQAIEEVRALDEFEAGFHQTDSDLSVQSLRPKMSTVVYRTDCAEWHPERLAELFTTEEVVSPPAINEAERVVWTVVEDRSAVRWADLRSVENVVHHLHLLHWDSDRSLLYINSSNLESLHEDLAHAVCGETASRITGEPIYRVLGDITRPVPTNVGVISLRNRSRRFSMYVGADVYEGFPVVEQQTRANTNIFVFGFVNGERVTLGAAQKGRIWSQQAAQSIFEWVRWCRRLGPKLQDASIELDALFRSFVRPKPLEARPELMPLAVDWPSVAFAGMGDSTKLRFQGTDAQIIDVELVLAEPDDQGPIRFNVCAEDWTAEYEANVRDGKLILRAIDDEAEVVRERGETEPLSDYLNREGMTIWFEHEVLIDGPDLLLELDRETPPIDLDQVRVLDWQGVDITRESQGRNRDPATVQARAAQRLVSLRDWDIVIDDDGTGELADLVAVKVLDDRIVIHLVHCKYSSEDAAGARVEDLYEVCGEAHRSAHHRQHLDAAVKNLIRRERDRQARHGSSGLLLGEGADLLALQDYIRMRRPELHVTIVQPGLSKTAARRRHLELLACADLYVKEVANASFDVWCSA